jgi:hypothetical protein
MIDPLPFSHTVPAASVPRTGQTNVLKVSPGQREAIAAFLDIPSVEFFDATVTITPARGGSFHVTGEVRAGVHQLCGVSLEPFPTTIHEEIDARFAPEDRLESVVKKEIRANRASKRQFWAIMMCRKAHLPRSLPSRSHQGPEYRPVRSWRRHVRHCKKIMDRLAESSRPRRSGNRQQTVRCPRTSAYPSMPWAVTTARQ